MGFDLKNATESDLKLISYIQAHRTTWLDLSIRQLALASGVSRSAIERFVKKNGCSSYSELKLRLSEQRAPAPASAYDMDEIMDCLRYIQSEYFENKLLEAARLLQGCRGILMIGIPQSGYIAQYGARLLLNLGIQAIPLTDPFFSTDVFSSGMGAVVFSVSGQTKEVINQVRVLSENNIPVVAITSNAQSELASWACCTLAYHIQIRKPRYDQTSQVPAVAIMEKLADLIKQMQTACT